jgi:hypothetical protein
MTASHNRPIVALKLPTKVPDLILMGRYVVERMTNNKNFPSPLPKLAVVSAAIDDLEKAEGVAQSRARGAVTMREVKRVALIALMDLLTAHVQSVADADRDHGAEIIMSAGMSVKKNPGGPKRTFSVKQLGVSGAVKVMVPVVARRASYDWEMSKDGGVTWQSLPSTLRATTFVSGLAPGSTVSFRYRTLTKNGESDWSQPVSIVVV